MIGLAVALLAVLAGVGVGFGVARRRSSARRAPPWTTSASSDEHRSAA